MKTSQEYEKSKIALKEKLAEAGKKIARLDAENTGFKSNHSLIRSVDFRADVAGDALTKRIGFLTEQLQRMEEENTRLKHALNRKSSEIQLSKGQKTNKRGKYPFFLQEDLSDLGSDEKASCAESWASALISELEHFKNEKKSGTPSHGYMGTPDMNLMDDFAEMKKLAYSPVVNANGYVSQTSENKSFNLEAYDTGNENISSTEIRKGNQKFQCNVSIPVQKILDLLEGINVISQDSGVEDFLPGKDDKLLPCKNSATYMVRLFRCKTAEFSAVLQQFVQTCNGLLSGEADIEQFVQSVASNLEWIINHCFSLQDSNKLNILIEDMPYLQPNTEEDKGLNFKPAYTESSVVNLEGNLIEKVESFIRIQLQDSNDIIENSQSEMPTMRQSEDNNFGDQAEEHKMMKQDIEQVMETNLECRKPCEEISHPENDLEYTNKSFKELEETCNDLKTRLEGETSKEVPDDGKQLQNDSEITSASEKLAECQETLRNLGKQLKALASPRDASLFDKVISTSADPVFIPVVCR